MLHISVIGARNEVPFPWEEPAFTLFCLRTLAGVLSCEREPSLQLAYKWLSAMLKTLSTDSAGLVQDARRG